MNDPPPPAQPSPDPQSGPRAPDTGWAQSWPCTGPTGIPPTPPPPGSPSPHPAAEAGAAGTVALGLGSWRPGPLDPVCSPARQVGPASLGTGALGPHRWASRAQTIGPHPGPGESGGRESRDDARGGVWVARRDRRQQVSQTVNPQPARAPGGGGAGQSLPSKRRARVRDAAPGEFAGPGKAPSRRHLPGRSPPFLGPWLSEPESAQGPGLASPKVAAPRTPARPLSPVQGAAPWLPPSPARRRRIRPLPPPPAALPSPGATCRDRPHLRVEPGRAGMGSGRAGGRRGQRTALGKLGRRLLRTLAKAATQ